EIEFLDFIPAQHHDPGLFRVGGVDQHFVGHGGLVLASRARNRGRAARSDVSGSRPPPPDDSVLRGRWMGWMGKACRGSSRRQARLSLGRNRPSDKKSRHKPGANSDRKSLSTFAEFAPARSKPEADGSAKASRRGVRRPSKPPEGENRGELSLPVRRLASRQRSQSNGSGAPRSNPRELAGNASRKTFRGAQNPFGATDRSG